MASAVGRFLLCLRLLWLDFRGLSLLGRGFTRHVGWVGYNFCYRYKAKISLAKGGGIRPKEICARFIDCNP